jgi:hypothetical protein
MSHPVVHFEIGCQDKAKLSAFYERVFDWEIDAGPMGAIDTGSTAGITGHIASLGHEPHQFTHFYIETSDIAATLAAVEAEGGQIIVPPVTLPDGTFAWFADLEGNTVGLWMPKASS